MPEAGEGRRTSIVEFDAGDTGPADGNQPVRGITLSHRDGLEVTVLTYGAYLVGVGVPNADGTGERTVVTQGPTDVASLQDQGGRFMGATVGRYANRIANATFELDGENYQLEANLGDHHIHGGSRGFDTRVWDYELIDDGDTVGVRFTLDSPDGDAGYPGAVSVESTYLVSQHSLVMEYRAHTDAPTPLNLTNHAYWNLAGPAEATVGSHRLSVRCDRMLAQDENGIPLPGAPIEVSQTRFVLDNALLEPVLEAGGIDDCFVVDPDHDGEVLVLEHPATNRQLGITTDQPGIQVFTANHLLPSHRGLAAEPQALPDSPNRADFPSAILRPGETYQHSTTYRFGW